MPAIRINYKFLVCSQNCGCQARGGFYVGCVEGGVEIELEGGSYDVPW